MYDNLHSLFKQDTDENNIDIRLVASLFTDGVCERTFLR